MEAVDKEETFQSLQIDLSKEFDCLSHDIFITDRITLLWRFLTFIKIIKWLL